MAKLFSLIRRCAGKAYEATSRFILGAHPNNTIFSYNFHNVRHIVSFLQECRRSWKRTDLIIVDIGSGRSPYYPIFADCTRHYVGVDFLESLPRNDSRPVLAIGGMAERLPLADACADVGISNQAFEHVLSPAAAASEAYRILKPGGTFLGSVPHVSPVHLEPYDFRRFTDLGVKQLLSEAGFTDIVVTGNGGVFRAAALMINMDMLLSARTDGKSQRFHSLGALCAFPLVGFINFAGLALDKITGDRNRTPANLCWIARKLPDR